jgi:hypothetical protein
MAAVMLTWKKVKPTPSIEHLTDTSESFVLHGRAGSGVIFAFDADLCADDTASLSEGRRDLNADMSALCPHFSRFAMDVHLGKNGEKSKSEFMFFAKQASLHQNTHYPLKTWTHTTAEEFSRKYDFVDLSPLIVDPIKNTCVTFTNLFCYLGSLMDVTLSDLPDANNHVQKSSQGFGMLAPLFFRSRKFTCTTKRIAFNSLITSVCSCGCESWAVTAEIQRRLRSFQTQCVKQMLNISTATMIEKHISAADMRKTLGVRDTWLGWPHLAKKVQSPTATWAGSQRQAQSISGG